jgi:hypothetical protein
MNRKSEFKEKEYFRIYYSLGYDRSLEKLRQELYKSGVEMPPSIAWLGRISSKYGWQKRIEEWDKKKSERLDQKVLEQAVVSDEQMLKITSAGILTFAKRLRGTPLLKNGEAVLDKDGHPIYVYEARLSAFEAKAMWDIQQQILKQRPMSQTNVFRAVIINQTVEEIQALPEDIKDKILQKLKEIQELYDNAYDSTFTFDKK